VASTLTNRGYGGLQLGHHARQHFRRPRWLDGEMTGRSSTLVAPKGREFLLIGSNPMAHQTRKPFCALLIGALREKQKRKWARFGFSSKVHQCAKARSCPMTASAGSPLPDEHIGLQ